MPNHKLLSKALSRFGERIADECLVNEETGDLVCKKCKKKVLVDWFELSLECTGCDEID